MPFLPGYVSFSPWLDSFRHDFIIGEIQLRNNDFFVLIYGFIIFEIPKLDIKNIPTNNNICISFFIKIFPYSIIFFAFSLYTLSSINLFINSVSSIFFFSNKIFGET